MHRGTLRRAVRYAVPTGDEAPVTRRARRENPRTPRHAAHGRREQWKRFRIAVAVTVVLVGVVGGPAAAPGVSAIGDDSTTSSVVTTAATTTVPVTTTTTPPTTSAPPTTT